MVTTQQAKKLLKAELERHNLPFSKLTARTISFIDLARERMVFVTIHDWQPNPLWDELVRFAVKNGFRIEAD